MTSMKQGKAISTKTTCSHHEFMIQSTRGSEIKTKREQRVLHVKTLHAIPQRGSVHSLHNAAFNAVEIRNGALHVFGGETRIRKGRKSHSRCTDASPLVYDCAAVLGKKRVPHRKHHASSYFDTPPSKILYTIQKILAANRGIIDMLWNSTRSFLPLTMPEIVDLFSKLCDLPLLLLGVLRVSPVVDNRRSVQWAEWRNWRKWIEWRYRRNWV